jgi:hypothetical protein
MVDAPGNILNNPRVSDYLRTVHILYSLVNYTSLAFQSTATSMSVLQMYCGLHFQFRLAHYYHP